jgi:hypothetical protein
VLTEIGYRDDQIAAFRASGAIQAEAPPMCH